MGISDVKHTLSPLLPPSNQSVKQTDTQSAVQSVSQPASHLVKQSVRHPVSQSVSQSAVWAGWRLVDGLFVWAEKSQTQQWPAPAPHNGSPHKGPHSGTMGWAQSGGVRLSWGYPPAHFRTPPPHTHTQPHPSSFKELLQVSSCVCGMRRKQGGTVQWKHSFEFHSRRCTMTENRDTCVANLLQVKERPARY